MIPDHDEFGNLPPGIYAATLDDVVERFRGAVPLSRRIRTTSMIDFFEFVSDFALGIYINGSYITTKLAPNDVDLLVLLPDDFEFESPEGRLLLRMQGDKKRNHLDIWPRGQMRHRTQIESILRDWTTDREDNVKGIIFVEVDR